MTLEQELEIVEILANINHLFQEAAEHINAQLEELNNSSGGSVR